MKSIKMLFVLSAVTATGVVAAPRAAHAFGQTCTGTNNACELWTNTGTTSSYPAIEGDSESSSQGGIFGTNSAAGFGVYGACLAAGGCRGVYGLSDFSSGIGVYGDGYAQGVYGQASHGQGVKGVANSAGYAGVFGVGISYGVYGSSTGTDSVGVYGSCSGTGCLAGNFANNVNVAGQLQINGTCQLGCPSDIRLKKNVEPLSGALDKLLKLQGVNFTWGNPEEHGNDSSVQTGFIAQDVEKVFPNWVQDDGYTAPDGQKYKALTPDPRQIAALEVEAIRTLKAKNDELEARLKALEDARRPVATTNVNGVGFGIAGLAMAAAIVVSRRKRDE